MVKSYYNESLYFLCTSQLLLYQCYTTSHTGLPEISKLHARRAYIGDILTEVNNNFISKSSSSKNMVPFPGS